MEDAIIKDLEVKKALKLIKKNLAKRYNLKKIPSNIELLNYLSVRPKEIITKPTRTISGVAPIAVMTKPARCPHVKSGIGPCIMCPGGPNSYYGNVPQSYTGKEPATMRAIRNKFDPYLQVFNRLEQYVLLNQNFDKAEIIIMGGTFPALSKKYQEEFVMYIFKALNDFSDLFLREKFDFVKFKKFFELPGNISDKKRINNIHKKLLKLKKKSTLEKEQLRNEDSKTRCVALCIETRPDYCKQKHINEMLKIGCTRVELGVQSIYDDVLNKINRGHSAKESIEATRLLKENGLKVIFHVILGLPGSSYDRDLEMFKTIFSNDDFKPDGLKIYPCVVIRGTKLYNLWKQKKYIPLILDKTVKLISEIKKIVPGYCRIIRIQRDISSNEIMACIKMTNLRQHVHNLIGNECRCIRCREIKNEKIENISFKTLEYNASKGKEYFIHAESNDKIIGFCRLRLSDKAFIRELHVYGSAVGIGDKGKIQHKGYGSKLMKIAEDIARKNYNKIYVTSGIGTKRYYMNKLKYKKDGFYVSKLLSS